MDNNLQILLDDEILDIGSSKEPYKILEIFTKTNIKPVIYTNSQLIPKIIVQTSENNIIKNKIDNNRREMIQELNPEYKYIFFDSISRRKFIKNNFKSDVLQV